MPWEVETDGGSNRFLQAMPRHVFDKFAGQLKSIPLTRGTVLVQRGARSGEVYFPDRGLVSLVKVMDDGRAAEVGCTGIGGMVGIAGLFGLEQVAYESIVSIEGSARCIGSAALRAELEDDRELRHFVLRWLYHHIDALTQTSACNRLHTLRQRCCRWLLLANDHARSSRFELTHDFLALLMGVNRPALSLALEVLQRRGMIKIQRSSLSIVDRPLLEQSACGCYEAMSHECNQLQTAIASTAPQERT
jgi:CRP-like cAMP-binding protein